MDQLNFKEVIYVQMWQEHPFLATALLAIKNVPRV